MCGSETDWNKAGRFQGQIDIPPMTMAAARRQQPATSSVMFTTLSRPTETADIILKRIRGVLAQIDGLVEIGHGLWRANSNPNPRRLVRPAGHLEACSETVQMPEGETIQDVWARSVTSWQQIAKGLTQEETALVVAHDAVNKTILCDLLGLTPADIWAVKQGNGGVTVVDINPDPSQPAVVTCLNLTSHFGSVIDRTAAGAL